MNSKKQSELYFGDPMSYKSKHGFEVGYKVAIERVLELLNTIDLPGYRGDGRIDREELARYIGERLK